MAIKTNTFLKEERLCSEKLLSLLFHKGSSFLVYPYRITHLLVQKDHHAPSAKVVFPVAKKKFKKSVDRNLIRRRMREIYRIQKQNILYIWLKADEQMLLSISYVGKEIHDFSFMEKKLILAINKLKTIYNEISDGSVQ